PTPQHFDNARDASGGEAPARSSRGSSAYPGDALRGTTDRLRLGLPVSRRPLALIRPVVHFEVRTNATVLAEAAGSVECNLPTLFPPLRLEVTPVFALPRSARLDGRRSLTLKRSWALTTLIRPPVVVRL